MDKWILIKSVSNYEQTLGELGCIFSGFKYNFAYAILLSIVAVCRWESSLYLLCKDYDFGRGVLKF